MPFIYQRTVHFQDTDAAGVVYFSNVLSFCHEAYEASLAASGINLKVFFTDPEIAIPIVHASVDFFHPMFCGEQYFIHLIPRAIADSKFEVTYDIFSREVNEQLVSKATTKHVCISSFNRSKVELPAHVKQWLQWYKAASDNLGDT